MPSTTSRSSPSSWILDGDDAILATFFMASAMMPPICLSLLRKWCNLGDHVP